MRDYVAQISQERSVSQKLRDDLKSLEVAARAKQSKLESKYVAEIKKLTSNFELYKKEAQLNLQSLKEQRTSLDSQKSLKDEMVQRLKQEKRILVQNNESSQKMHKEKMEKLQRELAAKVDEVKKLKARVATLKNNMAKLEMLNKKPA